MSQLSDFFYLWNGGRMIKPTIEDNVTICAGAIVIGNVKVESGAIVGAGAVVKHNVRRGTIVAGVPAKEIKAL